MGYYSPHPGLTPKALQSIEEGKSASHRILAWRIPSKQRTLAPTTKILCDTGHDDDGEQWAGRKLENLMTELDVQGAVCVARWYGGVLLGPVRFKHMEDAAKEAISVWRDQQRGGGLKRQKMEESVPQRSQPETMRPEELQRRKRELIRTLQRRDESISTLRTLLEQKKSAFFATANPSQPSSSTTSNSSPARNIDYEKMPFPRLQALEHARDASIAFLLKQIDKVEQEQAEETERQRKIAAAQAVEEEEDLEDAWSHLADSMLELPQPPHQSTKAAGRQ